MNNRLTTLFFLICSSLFAADIYVDNLAGSDDHDGRSAAAAYRTLAKGIAAVGPGDTLHLTPNPEPYHESLNFYGHPGGEPGKPITVDGHGAWLTGADPLPPEGWENWKDEVLQRQDILTTGFLIVDDTMVGMTHSFNVLKPGELCYMPYMYKRLYFNVPKGQKPEDFTIEVGQPDGTSVVLDQPWGHSHSVIGSVKRYNGLKQPTWVKVNGEPVELVAAKDRLAPGDWTVEDATMYYRPAKPVAELNLQAIIRGNGVAMNGSQSHFVFQNLNVRHVHNDGYNIHGSVKDATFINCNARDCGDEGFSSHDTCETVLDGAVYVNCDNGIANVGASVSVTRNVIITDSRHVGILMITRDTGHHTIENVILVDNPSQLSGSVMKVTNALILRTPDGPRTTAISAGPSTTLSQLTVLGNTSLSRADLGVTLSNVVFGPGQGGHHVRSSEPATDLVVKQLLLAPDLTISWGKKYPWTVRPFAEWLAETGVGENVETHDMPFAQSLIEGKMPEPLPTFGCTPELIKRWVTYAEQR